MENLLVHHTPVNDQIGNKINKEFFNLLQENPIAKAEYIWYYNIIFLIEGTIQRKVLGFNKSFLKKIYNLTKGIKYRIFKEKAGHIPLHLPSHVKGLVFMRRFRQFLLKEKHVYIPQGSPAGWWSWAALAWACPGCSRTSSWSCRPPSASGSSCGSHSPETWPVQWRVQYNFIFYIKLFFFEVLVSPFLKTSLCS